MLQNVHLKNLALIKEADINLGPGLNIMTGETGAGKSIIIGSINIALGDKASHSFIRNGADHGLVELVFDTHDMRVAQLLASYDIPFEDNQVIITRKITPESSTAKINGEAVTLSRLREVTSLLVDIHGQHEHQTLLNPANHLAIIDEFAGNKLESVKHELKENYSEYKKLRNEYRQFAQNPEELAKEISFLEFEIKEIEDAQLKANEDTLLEAEYKKLCSAQQINDGLMKLRSNFIDGDNSVISRLSDGLRELNYLITIEPELKSYQSPLMDLDSIARDFGHELSHFIDSHTFDAVKYNEIHDRLNDINRLKSKYGNSVEEILHYKEELANKLSSIKDYARNKASIAAKMDKIRSEVNKLAQNLSDLRKSSALILEKRISDNLKELNFLNVDFKISFSKADKIYENGFDKVEFMISTNVGEPVKPLVKVASGGELSRVMLAIKASIADADHTETLIFDEIDTGISGITAQKVAEKMASLCHAANISDCNVHNTQKDAAGNIPQHLNGHQLICITHLPQIAAMADTHFVIEKSVSDGSTISGIRKLSENDSVLELARLISGNIITQTTLKSAEEMKAAAASSNTTTAFSSSLINEAGNSGDGCDSMNL